LLTGLVLEGDVEGSQRHWREASAAYRAALAKQPDSTAAAVKLHGALLAQEDKAGAAAFAAKWVAEHAKDGGFVFHLSEVSIAQRDFPTAEKANKLRPDTPVFMDTLATALAAARQFDKALELQKKVVALDGKEPTWRLYIDAGQRAQARTELDALSQLGKDFKRQEEVQKLMREL
jgi:tetratricopeptide (TPR) repeat protein